MLDVFLYSNKRKLAIGACVISRVSFCTAFLEAERPDQAQSMAVLRTTTDHSGGRAPGAVFARGHFLI